MMTMTMMTISVRRGTKVRRRPMLSRTKVTRRALSLPSSFSRAAPSCRIASPFLAESCISLSQFYFRVRGNQNPESQVADRSALESPYAHVRRKRWIVSFSAPHIKSATLAPHRDTRDSHQQPRRIVSTVRTGAGPNDRWRSLASSSSVSPLSSG